MKFVSRAGSEVEATRSSRRRAIKRNRGEKLALRDYAMKLLRDNHKFMIHDLAHAFGVERKTVWLSLRSMNEATEQAS